MARARAEVLDADVLIVGGGLSGLTLAALLGRGGARVTVIDRDPPASQLKTGYDARATALSYGTTRILEAAGAWGDLEGESEPIADIRVADGDAPTYLHFSSDTAQGVPFGWNTDNLTLRRALHAAVARLPTVTHMAPAAAVSFFTEGGWVGAKIEGGRTARARLMVGADGRTSAVRDWLKIKTRAHDFKQTAIVCTIAHARDHENVAIEHFLPAGPFAVLPLTRGDDGAFRSSVIWSVATDEAPGILALSRPDFDAELQRLCGPHLGRVRCVSTPRGYPLKAFHAERYTGPRTALMAEAAHVVHPIAGQGLNLSMRDADLLARLVLDRLAVGLDPGAASLLEAYESGRRGDNFIMDKFTLLLTKLFSNDDPFLSFLRNAGLGAVEKMPVLKAFFERQAMGVTAGPEGKNARKAV